MQPVLGQALSTLSTWHCEWPLIMAAAKCGEGVRAASSGPGFVYIVYLAIDTGSCQGGEAASSGPGFVDSFYLAIDPGSCWQLAAVNVVWA